MKKYLLMWCVALPMVNILVGCNCVESQCNSESPRKSAPGLLQQTWMSLTSKDVAKSTKTDHAKSPVARTDERPATKAENADALLAKLFPRLAARKTPNGPSAKNASTKEPPIQEFITANGNETPSKQGALITLALPEFKKLPPPIQSSAPITIRSDEAPTTVETTGIAKANTITLKSVHIKYGASANYTVLVGRVMEWRKTMRLRYAAVEQEDKHGGSVMLEGGEDLERLRDGQHVRVRGTLIPAEGRLASARYRVDALEILD